MGVVEVPGVGMTATGWACRVCGATLPISTPFPWRCPNSTDHDRHHVLAIVETDAAIPHHTPTTIGPHDDPYLTYDQRFAWSAFAAAHGFDADARSELVGELDGAIADVSGVGFAPTPFGRSDRLSDELGFAGGGGIWVKDETGGVAGSHKARHLFTILLHLVAAERLGLIDERPPLAIASCGNAALAAATLARAAEWPIDVYVPTWMTDAVGDELDRLGARTHRCERRAADPPGDPAMLRFREAIGDGAVPFTVQGPENALALDGGRTIGWEIADQSGALGVELDRVVVQVGGGAFAACVGASLPVPLQTVQAAGCAPLARAWERAGDDILGGPTVLGRRWGELMTAWHDPRSIADGILDDETYDWLGIVAATDGRRDAPIVAAESDIVSAHRLARSAGFDVSPTGSAGLAGVLAIVDLVEPTERIAVIMSGIAR